MRKIIILILSITMLLSDNIIPEETIDIFREHSKQHNERVKENTNIPFQPIQLNKRVIESKKFSEKCFVVNKINIINNRQFQTKTLEQFYIQYINSCISLNEIQKILDDITNFYHKKSFITSSANLDIKKSKNNEITISIFEGKVYNFIYNINGKQDNNQSNNVLSTLENNILNLKLLDQGVEQINRLQSLNGKFNIQPSKKANYSDIIIDISKKYNVLGEFSYNNSSKDLKEPGYRKISFTLDNTLKLFDKFSTSYQTKTKDSDTNYNRQITASLTIPFNYWLFDFSYSYSKYLNTISSETSTYASYGYIRTNSLKVDRILFRDNSNKLLSSLYLEERANKSFLDQKLIDISSHNLNTSELTLKYNHIGKARTTFILGYKWGNNYFGGDKNRDNITAVEANKEFRVLKSEFDLHTNIKKNISYNLALKFQESKHELLSHEQFTTILGMYEDSGVEIKNTFNFSPNKGNISLTLKHTIGYINSKTEGYNDKGSSYETTINYNNKYLSFSLGKEFAIEYPTKGEDKNDFPETKLSLNLKSYF